MNFLDRTISFDLTYKDQIEIINSTISSLLPLIDKLKHRGVHKVWILQHLLGSRLRWSLLIYKIPSFTVLRFEQKTSLYLKKWLCIHRSNSIICFCSLISPYLLSIKKLSSILKSSKVSGQLILMNFLDLKVSSANIEITAGRWSAMTQ